MLDFDSAIRQRAYEIWQADGEIQGRALDYWLRAEAEIKAVRRPVTKRPGPAPKRATAIKIKKGAKA